MNFININNVILLYKLIGNNVIPIYFNRSNNVYLAKFINKK